MRNRDSAVYEFQLRLHSKLMANPNTTANIFFLNSGGLLTFWQQFEDFPPLFQHDNAYVHKTYFYISVCILISGVKVEKKSLIMIVFSQKETPFF